MKYLISTEYIPRISGAGAPAYVMSPRWGFIDFLISSKDVSSIDLGTHIVEAGVVAICYDCLRHLFEFFQVVAILDKLRMYYP